MVRVRPTHMSFSAVSTVSSLDPTTCFREHRPSAETRVHSLKRSESSSHENLVRSKWRDCKILRLHVVIDLLSPRADDTIVKWRTHSGIKRIFTNLKKLSYVKGFFLPFGSCTITKLDKVTSRQRGRCAWSHSSRGGLDPTVTVSPTFDRYGCSLTAKVTEDMARFSYNSAPHWIR